MQLGALTFPFRVEAIWGGQLEWHWRVFCCLLVFILVHGLFGSLVVAREVG
jgi:hypothetical protein